MKKLLYVSAGVLALSIFCARADDVAPGAAPAKTEPKAVVPPAPKPEMKEMTLTGTIIKQEIKGKKDQVVVAYSLTTGEGVTIKLPTAKSSLKSEDFVGSKVKLTGMGTEKEGHDGKKVTSIQKITNIVKAVEAAPAAPAAVPAPAK